MSLPLETIFNVQPSTGTNLGGGLWNATTGAANGVDLSRNATPAFTASDVVTNGTTTINFPTGTTPALDNTCEGNGFNHKGILYMIITFTDANNVVVDRTIAAATGELGNIGGTLAAMTSAFMALRTAGNRVDVLDDGAWVFTADVTATQFGTAQQPMIIQGYSVTPSDNPRDGARPVITMGSYFYSAVTSRYWFIRNFDVTGADTYAFNLGRYGTISNCKVTKSAGSFAMALQIGSSAIDCETTGVEAIIQVTSATGLVAACYVHDITGASGNGAINLVGGAVAVKNLIENIPIGIKLGGNQTSAYGNTIDGATVRGIDLDDGDYQNLGIYFNLITGSLVGIGNASSTNGSAGNYGNNLFGNTANYANIPNYEEHASTTYNDPNYASGTDYRVTMDDFTGAKGDFPPGAFGQAAGVGPIQVAYGC